MGKQSKNLFLNEEAIRRGEEYSRRHNTSVSQLVENFLSALPADEPATELPPIVRRMLGVARGGRGIEEYHDYLDEKYGKTA